MIQMSFRSPLWVVCVGVLACQPEADQAAGSDLEWTTMQDSTDRIASITGFSGPEAVRYDAVGDVFFVSNFNGDGSDRDANGFISRVTVDGTIDELQFATGTSDHPLHAPRGMFVQADTLWAADVDGLHGFDRRTGDHLAFVDFTSFEPGFLNDIAAGPDGALYVTDTGSSRIYRLSGGEVTVAVEDTMLGQPNGIAWDADNDQFLLMPWGGRQQLRAWSPVTDEIVEVATSAGGFFDGVEIVNGRVVVASQADSSLHVIEDGATRQIVQVVGRPADIGVDVRRHRVAVPYISLNQVDIWQLPNR